MVDTLTQGDEKVINRKTNLSFGIMFLVLLLTACGQVKPESPGLANPASVYCQELGYEEETREGEWGQYGMCIFPDGSECDTWDFFTGKCGQEFSYCEQQGYSLEEDQNIGTCFFPDGTSCPDFEFFKGQCGPEGE